jgi:hypothetical protein
MANYYLGIWPYYFKHSMFCFASVEFWESRKRGTVSDQAFNRKIFFDEVCGAGEGLAAFLAAI